MSKLPPVMALPLPVIQFNHSGSRGSGGLHDYAGQIIHINERKSRQLLLGMTANDCVRDRSNGKVPLSPGP